MRKLFATNGAFNQIVLALVLTVFALRAFVPVGFMPGQADGAHTIVICSGLEEKTVQVGDNGQLPHKNMQDMPCGFAVNAHASTHDVVAVVLPVLRTLKNEPPAPVDLPTTDTASAYQTRAPPILV